MAVAVAVGVGLGVTLGVEVSFPPPPPQAGSTITRNKLKAVNTTNHRFISLPPDLIMCRVASVVEPV
jgi:hypothetical protein